MKTGPFSIPDNRFPQRRYVVFERPDGHLSCREEYRYRNVDDDGGLVAEGWSPLPAFGLFGSVELADEHIEALLSQQNRLRP